MSSRQRRARAVARHCWRFVKSEFPYAVPRTFSLTFFVRQIGTSYSPSPARVTPTTPLTTGGASRRRGRATAEMGETHEDRHDGGDFGLPPAPPRRNNDAAHNNGHAAADASDAMRDARSSPARLSDRPSTSASVSSSVSEHVEDLAVRVAVRARPLVAKERVERARECLSYPRANAVLLGESRAFRFDDTFGPAATQGEVYERLVSPLVESCFRGYNATVLAYGQTGSGKTYTMGSGCFDVADDEIGIIPRVVNDVFAEAHRQAESGASETRVRCAFLEVHNEEVRDLLHPDTSPKRITIRERADGAIVAAGAREVSTRSADETLRLLELGCVARTTGGTKMNAQSSRSHAIFTIIIEQTHLTQEARRRHKGRYASAKFHLVDLAGSERNKKTRATGSRFQESININSGLLALGNVIAALSGDDTNRVGVGKSQTNGLKTHVPYRDSKLTRLLQDSLGGNSRTCVVACVSPVDTNFEETLNTLKYAQRARNIKNAVRVNRDPSAVAHVAHVAEQLVCKKNAERGAESERTYDSRRAETDGVRARASAAEAAARRNAEARAAAVTRADTVERALVRALVLAGDLADSKQLSVAGLARIAACATERARSTAAAESREGRPFPRAPDADGPAAANDDPDDPSTTATLRAQLEASRREVAEVMAASAAKDSALAEARDDLRRDEAIFAEKMREIKALKKEAKAAAKAGVRASSVSETVDGTFPLTPVAPRSSSFAKDEERGADGSLPPLALPGALPATPLGGAGASAAKVVSDAADSEKRSLVRQKAEIEIERAQLRREAAARARAYQQEKKSLERQLRELARNIGSKEKLIVDLTRNEREASLLTRRYENKVRSLEEEKASKEAEAARLRSELLAVERAAIEKTERTSSSENARAAAEARDATRTAYERKVRAAETEVRALRLAKAESDALRANTEALGTRAVFSDASEKTSDKTRELETEVSKMRADAEALRRRLRERDASYAAFSLQKATDAKATDAEVADLRRTRDAQSAKIDALASSESRHLEALRRATDELAAAKATIRRLGGEEMASAYVADAAAGDSEAGDIRALVDAETTKALARRAREEERTRLRTKRDSLLGEKRDLFARRDALLARRARAAEKLEAERATLVGAANAFARRGGSPSSVSKAPSKKETETLARLGFVRDALASGENVLSAEDARELRDAEDRADSVDAELDFLAAKLAELAELDRMFSPNDASVVPFGDERGDRGDGGFDDFSSLTASMPPAAARVAASAAMDRAVRAGLAQSETAAAAARLEMQLGDAQRAIEEMESASRMREMEFDRRVTELRLEHGRREAALLSLSERAAAAEDERERTAGADSAGADSRRTFDVDAIVADAEATKRRNEELRVAVSLLERERVELESAGRALEDKLERSSREAQTLRERVARLATSRANANSETVRRYDASSDARDDVHGAFTETHDDAHDDETGSLAPEDDAADDDELMSYWQTVPDASRTRSLPEPPRLPATPVGVARPGASLSTLSTSSDVFGVDASDEQARAFAFAGGDAGETIDRASAGSIRKAGVA